MMSIIYEAVARNRSALMLYYADYDMDRLLSGCSLPDFDLFTIFSIVRLDVLANSPGYLFRLGLVSRSSSRLMYSTALIFLSLPNYQLILLSSLHTASLLFLLMVFLLIQNELSSLSVFVLVFTLPK